MQDNLDTISPEWSLIDGQGLVRVYPVKSFQDAVLFVIKLAELADQKNHDPDVVLTHEKVIITLISHDKGGVTERDYSYAASVDELLASV